MLGVQIAPGSRFYRASLEHTPLTEAILRSARTNGAVHPGTNLEKPNLTGATMPDGRRREEE